MMQNLRFYINKKYRSSLKMKGLEPFLTRAEFYKKGLFVPECVDWIQARSLMRGVESGSQSYE